VILMDSFLIINSGSSSIKYEIFDMNLNSLYSGSIKKINSIFSKLKQYNIIACGYRVVHGGKFTKPIIIDNKVISYLESINDLAPLHNPKTISIIKILKKTFNKIKHIAVFDTAFHSTIPKQNYLYGIPYVFFSKYNIRKYGFHGISHKYLSDYGIKLLKKIKKPYSKIITCHLGSGSSICAIKNGKSYDTSLGFSPNDGLIMATRSGDIDPGIIFYMNKKLKYGINKIRDILNNKSGLLGLANSSKMEVLVNSKNQKSKLAIEMFVNHIVNYIGSYYASLGGCDAIIFSGGIGEVEYKVRQMIIKKLNHLGFMIDNNKNKQKLIDSNLISNNKSKPIFVMHTHEELEIAKNLLKFKTKGI